MGSQRALTWAADAPPDEPLDALVQALQVLSEVIYLWGSLPPLPAELLPEDYPWEELEHITATLNGWPMNAGTQAATALLAKYL